MPLLPHTRIVRPEPVILVADDDRDTRELYRACFDTSGFRTAEAGTGSQAIVSAVELSLRYGISYWDGAIVAAAEILEVSTIYTEDLNHGQRYGRVLAINPFLDA